MQLVNKEQLDSIVFGERTADFNLFIKINLERISVNKDSSEESTDS